MAHCICLYPCSSVYFMSNNFNQCLKTCPKNYFPLSVMLLARTPTVAASLRRCPHRPYLKQYETSEINFRQPLHLLLTYLIRLTPLQPPLLLFQNQKQIFQTPDRPFRLFPSFADKLPPLFPSTPANCLCKLVRISVCTLLFQFGVYLFKMAFIAAVFL